MDLAVKTNLYLALTARAVFKNAQTEKYLQKTGNVISVHFIQKSREKVPPYSVEQISVMIGRG